MKVGHLTSLILQLNALIDSRAEATIDEAHTHIEGKSVFPWLESRFSRAIDLSVFDDRLREEISTELLSIYEGYAGDEGRKWGVRNSGLCLLVAWVNEIIQLNWAEEEAA